MRNLFPHLFEGMLSFEDETFIKEGRTVTSSINNSDLTL